MSGAWEVVARYLTIGEAEVAASALDAAGIDCDLVDDKIVGVDWGMSQAVGGVKVVVRPEDLDAAREVVWSAAATPPLSETAAEESSAPSPPHPGPPHCPECGATDARPIPRFKFFLAIAALFLGIGMAVDQVGLGFAAVVGLTLALLITPSHRCGQCGHRWNRPEERVEAPPPDLADTIEHPCPRCGSLEVHRINYRRMKAIPLLLNAAILVVGPLWLMKPKQKCDACGLEIR